MELYKLCIVKMIYMWQVLDMYIETSVSWARFFNPVVKLVLENYPFSSLSQLRSPHFIRILCSMFVGLHSSFSHCHLTGM